MRHGVASRAVFGAIVLAGASLLGAGPSAQAPQAEVEGNKKPVAWLGGRVPDVSSRDQHLTDPVLVGGFDVHAHLNPDSSGGGQEPRAYDVVETARLLKTRGFRGFVFKTHMDSGSAGGAYLARKAVPGIEVFGRMALNTTVGGINPAVVAQFTAIAGGYGRVVEMPTRDSVQTVGRLKEENRPWVLPWAKLFPNIPTAVATVKNGEVLPEVKALFTMLATRRTVDSDGPVAVATGHATPEEHVLLAREARSHGLTTIVTHPDNVPLEQLVQLAKDGCFIEVNASGGFAHGRDAETWAPVAVQRIRALGVEHVLMGSDGGQTDRPNPGDMLAMAAKALRAHGLTDAELHTIFADNAARSLGLPVKAAPAPPAKAPAKKPAGHAPVDGAR